ncbi:MAG: hypothetical protein SGPRY_006857 [Prymnesium sp.]
MVPPGCHHPGGVDTGVGSAACENAPHTVRQLDRVSEMRVALPGVFGDTPEARTYPGFHNGKGKVDPTEGERDTDEHNRRRRRHKRKRREEEDRQPGGRQAEEARTNESATAAERQENNLKKNFHFDDDSFSMKTRHFDWRRICDKFGWNSEKLCGPVVMTFAGPRTRELCYMNTSHK